MNQVLRQKQMSELIAQRGECSIEELMERFGVSGMTVRRDLQSLADQGKVIRTHGGAAMAERISFEFEFLNRVRENQAAKEAIAAAAVVQIKDGESVMLDSGTTTLELAKRLRGRQRLTVITSSLPIAAQLQYDQRHRGFAAWRAFARLFARSGRALSRSRTSKLCGPTWLFSGPTPSMARRRVSGVARVGAHADEDGRFGRPRVCRCRRLKAGQDRPVAIRPAHGLGRPDHRCRGGPFGLGIAEESRRPRY